MSLRPDGRVPICERPCGTCPFGGGPRAIELDAERVEEIAAASSFWCHTAAQGPGHAVLCEGWSRRFQPQLVTVMARLDGLVRVNPYELPELDERERRRQRRAVKMKDR
jgi:hypothetical protein